MVEVRIEEMFGSDRSRSKDYERAVVDAPKNYLTGPTLLEMSGNLNSS
jgi:hypothetical protein